MSTAIPGVTDGTNVNTQQNSTLQANTDQALNSLNFQTFLQLLTTQLKNQDPMHPQDESQFLGQLAQFGGLQQQIQTNTLLTQLNGQKDLGQQSLATSYLGHAVLAPGSSFNKNSDGAVPFGYNLDAQASEMNIQIYNSDGTVVKTLTPQDGSALTAGNHTVSWDGTMQDGSQAPSGTYKAVITAYNSDGNQVTNKLLTYGVAVAVDTDATGDTQLELADGRAVAFGDISQVVVASTSSSTGSGNTSGE
jgi:flagellar basal-body rod modification protein FlgD